MPKSKVRAKHRKASKSGSAREEWPWPSKYAIDRVTPTVAYYSCGGSLKAEKVAAAIVWEVASGVISEWTLICRENAGSPRLHRLMNEKIEAVADGIVRDLFKGTAPLCSGWFVEGCWCGCSSVAEFAQSIGFCDRRVFDVCSDDLLAAWDEEIWPRFVRTGVARSDNLGLLEHEPGRLVW